MSVHIGNLAAKDFRQGMYHTVLPVVDEFLFSHYHGPEMIFESFNLGASDLIQIF